MEDVNAMAEPVSKASSPANAPKTEGGRPVFSPETLRSTERAVQRSRNSACRRCGSTDHHYSTAKLCPKHPNFDPARVDAKAKAAGSRILYFPTNEPEHADGARRGFAPS